MRSFLLLVAANFTCMLMVPTVDLGTSELPSLAAPRTEMPVHHADSVPPLPTATTPDLYAPSPSFVYRPVSWRSPRTVAILQIKAILTL